MGGKVDLSKSTIWYKIYSFLVSLSIPLSHNIETIFIDSFYADMESFHEWLY